MNWIYKPYWLGLMFLLSNPIKHKTLHLRRLTKMLATSRQAKSNWFVLSVPKLKGNKIFSARDRPKKMHRWKLSQVKTCSKEIFHHRTIWLMVKMPSKESWKSSNFKTFASRHLLKNSWSLSSRWNFKRSKRHLLPDSSNSRGELNAG